MRIHRLADGPVDLEVTEATVVEGNYGSQIEFQGADVANGEPTKLYISESSAGRQLQRLGLTVETCVANALHFEHVQKNGQTYVNIYQSLGAEAAAAQSAAQPSAPAPAAQAARRVNPPTISADDALDAVKGLYGKCIMEACEAASAMRDVHGYTPDANTVASMAATLFIQASRKL